MKPPRASVFAAACVAARLAGGVLLGSDAGSEVVVLFNSKVPESKTVAEYYAGRREVPANNLIGIDFPDVNGISRSDYNRLVAEPLILELSRRGLAVFRRESIPAHDGRPARVSYLTLGSSIRYLLLSFGTPYRVAPDPSIDAVRDEGAPATIPAELRRNEASMDSELTLLPIFGRNPIFGALNNPYLMVTNTSLLHPTNGVLLVTRLDGPTPAIAKGLVDSAIEAERDGLNGRAYFDLRNIGGAYKTGDDWIGHAAEMARAAGYDTVVDRQPATFGAGFPMSQIAIYAGWYAESACGPLALPKVEFMPGAIAYHLHSYSAQTPREPHAHWVGPLLAKGAAVTLGCVDEPYLEATPNIGGFLERLIVQRFTVGEAGVACQPALSWQTIVVGDPLYRPFGQSPAQLADRHGQHPLAAWAMVRKANLAVAYGRPAAAVAAGLTNAPLAQTSPVLAEKIADLEASKPNLPLAVEWAGRALAHGGTPQQRSRLWRQLAEWQSASSPLEAVHSLDQFAEEFPDHPDLLAIREHELELARAARRPAIVLRVEAEIRQLKSKPPGSSL